MSCNSNSLSFMEHLHIYELHKFVSLINSFSNIQSNCVCFVELGEFVPDAWHNE